MKCRSGPPLGPIPPRLRARLNGYVKNVCKNFMPREFVDFFFDKFQVIVHFKSWRGNDRSLVSMMA
jgi:hypothetical protein